MASYRKKGKGWEARTSYQENGKQVPITKGGFTTKKMAEKWANDIEHRKLSGRGLVKSNTTLYVYFKEWYAIYKEPLLSQNTKLRYSYAIKVLKANFNRQAMTKISRTAYQRFLNEYGKTHALASSKKLNTQIRAAVRSAMEDGIIVKDFTAHTSISGHASKDAELKYLDLDDTKKLIADLKTDISPNHPTKFMALVAIYTGARFSEVAGLTWDNISTKKDTMTIEKTWDVVKNTGFKPTKNAQSVRTIAITTELIQMFKEYHQKQRVMQIGHGLINDNNLVFITAAGKVPSNNAANKTLTNALTRVDGKVITFHGLRHTHASYLIYKGVSIYYISERLGHSNYSITMQVYSHLIHEMRAKEDSKLKLAMASL